MNFNILQMIKSELHKSFFAQTSSVKTFKQHKTIFSAAFQFKSLIILIILEQSVINTHTVSLEERKKQV